MSKHKKEEFENQLRELQDDIMNLTKKLASSAPKQQTSAIYLAEVQKKHSKSTRKTNNPKGIETENHYKQTAEIIELKQYILDLTRERDYANHQRNEIIAQQTELNKENEELRNTVIEYGRLKTLFEHLKQDYNSLQISLESSERIRKQQKDLITLLQHATTSVHITHTAKEQGPVLSLEKQQNGQTDSSTKMFVPLCNEELSFNDTWPENSISKALQSRASDGAAHIAPSHHPTAPIPPTTAPHTPVPLPTHTPSAGRGGTSRQPVSVAAPELRSRHSSPCRSGGGTGTGSELSAAHTNMGGSRPPRRARPESLHSKSVGHTPAARVTSGVSRPVVVAANNMTIARGPTSSVTARLPSYMRRLDETKKIGTDPTQTHRHRRADPVPLDRRRPMSCSGRRERRASISSTSSNSVSNGGKSGSRRINGVYSFSESSAKRVSGISGQSKSRPHSAPFSGRGREVSRNMLGR